MKQLGIGILVLSFAFTAACGGQKSGKALVSVNGEKVTEGDLSFLATVNPRIKAQLSNPAAQKQILNNLVDQTLLYQEAVKEGIPNKKDVKEKIELYRKVLVAQALIEGETEKAAKKYYDEHKDEFNKLGLSHIMIQYGTFDAKRTPGSKSKTPEKITRSEEEALKMIEELRARVERGEAFEKVAETSSEDTASARQGGSLGKVGKVERNLEARGLGPVLEKAFDLKVGEVAGPIKTQKGYHLVLVTSPAEQEPFEEAKDRITFKVQADARESLLGRLKKDADIEWADAKNAVKKEEKAAVAPTPAPAPSPEQAPAQAAPAPAAPSAAPTTETKTNP